MRHPVAHAVFRMLMGLFLLTSAQSMLAGIIDSSILDASAQSLSGKSGSVSGPFTNDPAPVGGTYGHFETNPVSTAGPIPVNPESIPFPGTTGIATGTSLNSLDVIDTGTQTIISVTLDNSLAFTNSDGGTYQAFANSGFAVQFTLFGNTPFFLTGTTGWHPDDALGLLRIEGGPVFIFTPKDGAGHPISMSGILGPGTYTFSGSTAVGATESFNYTEHSFLSATLTLVPEPGSALLLAAGLIPALARRRRIR